MRIFVIFVNIKPHGSQNFKTLLLQITTESFLTLSLIFLPMVLTKTTYGIFEILKIEILTIFSPIAPRKTAFGIFKILSSDF